jgi:hypothetical protein
MVSAIEGSGGLGAMASANAAGVDAISSGQTITFTRYQRVVLPLDGYVFWVKASLLAPVGTRTPSPLQGHLIPEPGELVTQAATWTVKGSLHYSSNNTQDEAEGFSVNRVIFTSLSEIEEIQAPNPGVLYIGEFDGMVFAFSRRTMLYRQAGLFHYQGDAVYPTMLTQLVNSIDDLDMDSVIVSNSLPIWLTLNRIVTMYPSFLIPDGAVPSYCAVHIDPPGTIGLQAAPWISPTNGSHYQLARDRVRLTAYGLSNAMALDLQDYILDYSLNTDAFGIMNIPAWRDEKRTQSELGTIAQKKTMDVEVNYYQSTVRDLAIQYITSSFIDLLFPAPPPPSMGGALDFSTAINSALIGAI